MNAYKGKLPVICSTCGDEFKTFPCRLKKYNFCSRECANKGQSSLTNVQGIPWSPEEIALLREHYPMMGAGCSIHLPRHNKPQISHAAHRLGIGSDKAPGIGMRDAWVRRFWRRVDKSSRKKCWPWTGNLNGHGYGTVRFTPTPHVHKSLGTHVVAWELTNGPITGGEYVLHRCRFRSCCNPAHLYLGTAQDNANDRERDGMTHKGPRNGRSNLTEKVVTEMRRLAKTGVTLPKISSMFPTVAYPNILKAVRGETWKHVSEYPVLP